MDQLTALDVARQEFGRRLRAVGPGDWDRPTPCAGWNVRDLVEHGAVGQQPPWDAFWGARYAVVEDPDGNAVGIMSAIDPDRRGPAPGDA